MEKQLIKTRYTDNEPEDFKQLIEGKIQIARDEFNELAASLKASNSNGDDAAIAGKTLEDSSATYKKEQTNQLAARQKNSLKQPETALGRINNKTYGICKITGKLIPTERLRAVPHTAMSMEAELKQAS